MSTQPTSAPAEGQIQQQTDPGLDTAMGGWGDGEREGAPLTQSPGDRPAQELPAQERPATQAPVKAATPIQAPAQDTAAIIRAAVESTAQAMTKSQGQTAGMERAQKEMTQEEFETRYGITKYDAKHLERLFDKDPAKAAQVLNELQKNAYTAAIRMSNDLIEARMTAEQGKYAQRFQKVEAFIAEQTEARANDRFYKAFPDLVPESPVVQEILDAVQARLKDKTLPAFKNEADAFQFVADATNRKIAAMREKYGGTPRGTPSGQQSQPSTRQPAMASSSARPGGQQSRPKNDIDAVMSSWDEAPE